MKFTLIQILVMAAVTALLRFLPFLVFPADGSAPRSSPTSARFFLTALWQCW